MFKYTVSLAQCLAQKKVAQLLFVAVYCWRGRQVVIIVICTINLQLMAITLVIIVIRVGRLVLMAVSSTIST